ncbi:MAG: diguanylate cyclase [Clostridium sp.]
MAKVKTSIIKKIGITTSLFVFIMFIAYYLFLNIQIKTYLVKQSKEQLVKESQYLCSEIEMFLQKYVVIINQAKSNPDFIKLSKDIEDPSKKREHPLFLKVIGELNNMYDLDNNIAQSYIALEGANDVITNVYDYNISPGYDLSLREWYINTIKGNKTTITTPYVDTITNETTITIAAPLIDNRKVLGAVGVDILMKDINTIMEKFNSKTNVDVGLMYKSGQILYNPGYIETDEAFTLFIQNLLEKELADKVLSGKSGIAKYTYQEQEKYIAYMPVKNTDLIVFTNINESEILAPVNNFLYINLSILSGLLIIMTVLLLILQRVVSRPITFICSEMENYSNNNTISIPQKYLERKDEIGALSKGITIMLNNISNFIFNLEEKNQELYNAKEIINAEGILFKTTLHSLGDGVISTDKNGDILIMNEVAENLTGWKNHDALGLPFETVFNIVNGVTYETCLSPVKRVLEEGRIVKLEENTILINKKGQQIPIEDSAAPVLDDAGNIAGIVVVFRDHTDKKQKQNEIAYLSYHDQLTGLYNRHFFQEELIRLDAKQSLPLSLVMLDVNGLKLTNDAFGHQMGDKLLGIFADTMKKVCREDDIISRIGGDEFVLILPKTSHKETELIVKQILSELEQRRLNEIIISVSIGWEIKTSQEQNTMDVFAKAEEHMYRKKLIESKSMRSKTIEVIIKTLNETNEREKIHSEKVSKISRKIGESLNLEQELLHEIEMAGLLHDVGKIAIDSSILNKPGKLTDSEYLTIKRHAEIGYHILKSVDAYSDISDYALAHHEYWDGTGYPRGIKGEEIPLVARIISIADVYEAMTGERPYRRVMSKQEAMHELKRCAGTQFDPNIIKAFCENVDV